MALGPLALTACERFTSLGDTSRDVPRDPPGAEAAASTPPPAAAAVIRPAPAALAEGASGQLRSKHNHRAGDDAVPLCLDFEGAPAAVGAYGQLFPCAHTGADGHLVVRAAGSADEIVLETRSGACVGFRGGFSGAPAVLKACDGDRDDSDYLTVVPAFPDDPALDNGGYVKLKASRLPEDLCLDVVGAPGGFDGKAQLYACSDTHTDGQWRLVDPSRPDGCTSRPRPYDAIMAEVDPALPAPPRPATVQQPAIAYDVQGHRGARGKRPENTLAAFAYALQQGVTTLELDLVASADGKLVVSHEDELTKTCDFRKGLAGTPPPGHPHISRMPYASIHQSYDCGIAVSGNFPEQVSVCGEKRPLLEHVLAFAEGWMDTNSHPAGISEIAYNIEIKDRGALSEIQAVDGLVRVVQAYGAQLRTTIQAFAPGLSDDGLAYAASKGVLTSRVQEEHAPVPSFVDVNSVDFKALTTTMVMADHSMGKLVIPWTVNDVADLDRLRAMGVDGVITDYPSRADPVVCAPPGAPPSGAVGKLKNKLRGNLCLDFTGRPGTTGAPAQLWDCHDTHLDGSLQLLAGDGADALWLQVINTASGLCLDVRGSPGGKGSPAQLARCDGSVDQWFQPAPHPDGLHVQLKSRAPDATGTCTSGLCLDAQGTPGSRASVLQLGCCEATSDDGAWAFCPGL